MASFIFTLLAIAAALAAGVAAGYMYRKNVQEKKIGRTEEYARNLLDDAQRRAEEKKKESILEAKEEVIRLKNELDREIRDRRAEVQRSERRVTQREETLDKKADNLDARETGLERKQNELDRLTAEAQEYSVRQKTAAEEAEKTAKDMEEKSRAELERVAKMTQDEARDMIVQRTQEGKAVARATDPNFREGRPPKFDTEQLDHARALLDDHSYAQVVKLTGISKSTLIRERKRRKIQSICQVV